jgi:hypothetical protein
MILKSFIFYSPLTNFYPKQKARTGGMIKNNSMTTSKQ